MRTATYRATLSHDPLAPPLPPSLPPSLVSAGCVLMIVVCLRPPRCVSTGLVVVRLAAMAIAREREREHDVSGRARLSVSNGEFGKRTTRSQFQKGRAAKKRARAQASLARA